MGKRSVSTCRIKTDQSQETLTVAIKNSNQKYSRPFKLNVYDEDSKTKEKLPVYLNEERITEDIIGPSEEKEYKINVSNADRKVVFQIIQENSGGGMKMGVSKSSKHPTHVEFQMK
ncbi:hypothetical protein M3638_04430 [Oceanobacillus profundus]|uniref:hypothetical protein n=1 Tax=Oceanobacillus profundus TaxID=372463 RepID=UPI00203A4CBA|nr:hypothetical protein [Oceanobacillus profundus]MBR3120459.1 hypothetical protein [Oceanobacillus sp.]MCM3397085.1 hypothetical protein [Oceanobacillus profundus]